MKYEFKISERIFICKKCGISFTDSHKGINSTRKFCSVKCASSIARIAWNKGKRGISEETFKKMSSTRKGRPAWNKGIKGVPLSEEHKKKLSESHKGKNTKPKKIFVCKICNISFTNTHKNVQFCSNRCSGINRRNTHTKEYTCQKCGIIFLANLFNKKKGKGKYCSRRCSWDSLKKEDKQIRNKHSGTEYAKWRTSVFTRDNWTCQTCRKRGSYLEAHHIKSWKNFPNLRLESSNGVTLCKPCHVLANREQRKFEKMYE